MGGDNMAMKRKIDVGDKYGMLILIEWKTPPQKSIFKCDCGNLTESIPSDVRKGRTVSCGCKRKNKPKTHGYCIGGKIEKLYYVWTSMKQRCGNHKNKDYPLYGGRGISVCSEWVNSYSNFREWAMSNGYRDNSCIDRQENDGNYEPSNCKWVTNKENCNNTRKNNLLIYNGEAHCISEWSEITGISRSTISARVNSYGWDVKRALTEPASKGKNQFTKK
jgi:hypothetical protein